MLALGIEQQMSQVLFMYLGQTSGCWDHHAKATERSLLPEVLGQRFELALTSLNDTAAANVVCVSHGGHQSADTDSVSQSGRKCCSLGEGEGTTMKGISLCVSDVCSNFILSQT